MGNITISIEEYKKYIEMQVRFSILDEKLDKSDRLLYVSEVRSILGLKELPDEV